MTPDPFVLMLSRVQFGLTIGFHYIFVPLTLGLIVAVAIMDTLRVTTGRHDWRRAARFWYRFFVLAWFIGMATGYPLRLQLEQQWAGYSVHARAVIHAIMGMEGMIAPAMVSLVLVLASLASGQPALDRAITRWILAAVMLLQAACIVTLNAWMQHPVGTESGAAGAQIVSLREIFLSPTAITKVAHTLSAGILTGAMFIVAVSSFYLLRRRHRDVARISLSLALPMAAIALGAVVWSGHESARVVMTTQPMKFAAIEAHWEQGSGPSPLTLFAWPDTALQANQFAVTVPRLMSWLATHSDASPPGIRELLVAAEARIAEALREGAGEAGAGWRQLHDRTSRTRTDWRGLSDAERVHATALASVPSVPTLFAGFRLMVGTAFVLAIVLGGALLYRREVFEGGDRWPLRLLCLALPLPWLATFAGWTVAEVGRQPWIVYEQMATASAARLQPAASAVAEFLTYVSAYGLLAMLFVAIARALLRAGPRRQLWNSAWRYRLRSLFGSRLQRRTAAAARASAWISRPSRARPGRPPG
ncbi:MAG: cytochrome ubiquinol oxidase subunit I [Burkholderiales bacterium]|nr:cytochrome ubiquinol oxidase subunit I [Burkholderiales bacterium]